MITLGTTYYNNPKNMIEFLETHKDYFEEIIVVDDGSKIYPAKDIIKNYDNITLYEVVNDIGFNSHGCRNLIMQKASNEWVMLLDSDRILIDPEYTIDRIYEYNLLKNKVYHFSAIVDMKPQTLHKSVNDFLISKSAFFSAGGYDEELTGYRTGDREMLQQIESIHPNSSVWIEDITICLTREPSIMLGDSNVYKDHEILPSSLYNLIRDRMKRPNPNKEIIKFEYKQIF